MFLSRFSGLLQRSALRQTLALLALFLAITLAAWGGTYWLVQREMTQAVDARLSARMADALAALDMGAVLPPPGDGQSAALSPAEGADPDGFFNTEGPHKHGDDYRFLSRLTPQGRVVLGENVERQEELRELLATGMQGTLAVTLLATLAAGLWMAQRGQRRLNVVNAGLAEVARGRLDTRITLEGPRDDLSRLAGRINATTARLDQAMTQMRVQSSNIAHDLRTPLARLRAQLERSLLALVEQDRPVRADDLGVALEQIDRITGTFDALLRLARIESGAGRAGFAPLDLGTLAEQLAETFGPVVEEAGQCLTLRCCDPARITGDADLLVQLGANLIQNALRYGPAGQEITLEVQGPRLVIRDQGPGIPLAEREAVLQPLYQSDTTRQEEGFGLGLALVRAIAELHAARLSLSDGAGGRGLTVTLEFPALPEA